MDLSNTHNVFNNDRGTGDFKIWISTTPQTPDNNLSSSFGTLVVSNTLAFNSNASPNPSQSFTFTPTLGRYVTFRAGAFPGFAGTGLSEIVLHGCVPFAAQSFKVEIDLPSQFDIQGSFTLGAASDGFDPLTEPVTLQLGTYSVTIPAGSFRKDGRGFEFHGVIKGAFLEMEITPLAQNRFRLEAEGRNANLAGTTNPVELDLTVGDDCGTTLVHARIDRE